MQKHRKSQFHAFALTVFGFEEHLVFIFVIFADSLEYIINLNIA
jgi:hypothetical protein